MNEVKGIKLPPEFAQIDKFVDFGEVTFTPFWNSKGEKCNLVAHGPVFQFYGKDGRGADVLKGMMFVMNYSVSIENESFLKLTLLARQNEIHKVTFPTKRKLYEAAIYATDQIENTFAFILGFDEKQIKCNLNSTYFNIKENNLEMCNIAFDIKNNIPIIKATHNDQKFSKTRLMIVINAPKHSFAFSNAIPDGLPVNMIPNTITYTDLTKADVVHRFVLGGPDIAQTIVLYFSTLAAKAGSPMPVIKKYTIPNEVEEVKEEEPKKVSNDVKLQARGSRARSHVINQPEPTKLAEEKPAEKPKLAEKPEAIAPKPVPAAKPEEKTVVTPKPVPTVAKVEEKPVPAAKVEEKPVPTTTKAEEKTVITPKPIPTTAKAEEKAVITPKPIPTAARTEEKTVITPKAIPISEPKVTLQDGKITPVQQKVSVSQVTKIERKVITGKTITISNERIPINKEKKPVEEPKPAEAAAKKDDDFVFVPAPTDKVSSRRRPVATKAKMMREKKVEEKKESDDEEYSIDKILSTIRKSTTPCGMPQKLAAARNELKELKQPEKLVMPGFEELLGVMAVAPPKKSPEVTANAINDVANTFKEIPSLFEGLPEFIDQSLEEITHDTIESAAGVPEIDLNTVLPIAKFPPNDEMDFKYASSSSTVLINDTMMIIEEINSNGSKKITNSTGGDRLAFLTAAFLMNGLRKITPNVLKSSPSQLTDLFDAFAEIELDGLKECIEAAKAGSDPAQQFSLFAYSILNAQLFVGLFRAIKKDRGLVDTWYSNAALVSYVPDLETVLNLLTPLIIGHEIELVPKENLVSSQSDEDIDHYIIMPAYDFRRFTVVSSRCINSEEQENFVAKICASALYLSTIPKGLTLPTQKSKNPFQILEDIAGREGKIDYQGFPEMVQAIKAAKSMEKTIDKVVAFFKSGIKKRCVHEWFFLLTLQRDLTSKYFYEDSVMRDNYKIKMAVSALAKMMK